MSNWNSEIEFSADFNKEMSVVVGYEIDEALKYYMEDDWLHLSLDNDEMVIGIHSEAQYDGVNLQKTIPLDGALSDFIDDFVCSELDTMHKIKASFSKSLDIINKKITELEGEIA